MDSLLLLFVFLVCASTAIAQQWERLPLNVGHLDKLVQNPYNEKEIVGYIQSGDFFHSMDGGLSWRRIERDSVPLTGAYSHVTIDMHGNFYLLRYSEGLWRSADKGVTWSPLLMLGTGHFHGDSRTKIASDGTIFVWDGSAQVLYRSVDNGSSWQDIGPDEIDYGLDIFVDPDNSNLNAILRQKYVVVTTDGGKIWETHPLPATARSVLFSREFEGTLIFRLSLGKDSSEFVESRDTGKTWELVTTLAVRVAQGDCNGLLVGDKYLQMNAETSIYLLCHTLQRSTDSGRTFRQITNFRIEDIVKVGTELIASVPLRGLIRSTDFGDTWAPVPSPPEQFRVNEFEFAHANDDTLFVLMGDRESNEGSTRFLLESDNGGSTWDTLFTTHSNRPHGLFVDAGNSSRYYLHAGVPDDRYGDPENRYILLSGVAGQIAPDTILVTTSIPRPTDIYPTETFRCLPSERFPGWIYASRHTNSIGWSSDRGERWEWRTLPISISQVLPWPSQLDPLRIVITAYEQNPIVPYNQSGLYYTSDGGRSFEWVNRKEAFGNLHARWLFTSSEDRYFLYDPPDSSSLDYGHTWEFTHEGLADGTTHMHNHQSHGETIMQTSTGMYIFRDGRWNLLRDREGTSIWSDEIQARWGGASFIDYTGTYVYISVPMHGLFRIVTQPVTGIGVKNQPTPSDPQLEVYPNPAVTRVHISWEGTPSARTTRIRIHDVLGREVWRVEDVPATGALTWDGRRYDETLVLSGLYFILLTDGSGASATSSLILR